MTKLSALLVSIAICSTAAFAAADKPCPVREPGQAFPWQKDGLMRGDEWADLHIDLDVKGRPTNCRVGKNQLKPETGFWMCRASMAQSNFEPILKDGVPVAGTVTRHFVLLGREHRNIDQAARKQFFKDHPEERPSCYPQ